MANIKEYKYKLIKNFFTKEELNILKIYCKNKLNENWQTDAQVALSPAWVKDPLMDTLLELKTSLMEKETGLKLFKTYAFWRYYVYGSILKTHIDRSSCEISVTACIHKTENWPIYMEDNSIEIEEGDAVAYLGCELKHGRKTFQGDGCAQVFMHYVDQNGPLAKYKDDPEYLLKKERGLA